MAGIALEYGLSAASLGNHKGRHLSRQLLKSQQVRELVNLDTLAGDVAMMRERCLDILERAKRKGCMNTELLCKRVDYLITEDRKIHIKASDLGISDFVFTIDDFLEKVTAENPALSEYKVLSVKKEYFGNIDINDEFFDSFKEDYDSFSDWFNRKADEVAYICQSEKGNILAFLYIKKEDKDENSGDISPVFTPKTRLNIGTFKVISNGFKLGERFLKIVFDNALSNNVDEIYVTLFRSREEHDRLIGLLQDWGFTKYGIKNTKTGNEEVYTKNFRPLPDKDHPNLHIHSYR